MAKKFYNSLTDEKKVEEPVVETTEEVKVVEEKPKKRSTKIGYIANCEKVNVRKQPTIGDNVVTILSAGAAVEIKGEKNGFYEITDGNYVMKEFVNC